MNNGDYTQDFITEFIQLYRELPCLWLRTEKSYKNKVERNKAYDVLVQKLRQVNKNANRDMVIRKINSLRTAFRREYTKAQKSHNKKLQNRYKPNWYYYNHLTFIMDQNQNETLSPTYDDSMLDIEDDVGKIEQPSSTESRPNSPNKFNPIIVKVKGFEEPESQQTVSSCSRQNVGEEFGAYIVSKLNKSVERQCILAENIISDVLCRANLGTLSENTMLTDMPPPHCDYVMTSH